MKKEHRSANTAIVTAILNSSLNSSQFTIIARTNTNVIISVISCNISAIESQQISFSHRRTSTAVDKSLFFSSDLRQKLLKVSEKSKQIKKRKKVSLTKNENDNENEKDVAVQRKLNKFTRWNVFFHFINRLWKYVTLECYEKSFDIDSNAEQAARTKIFDTIKNFKNKIISRMKIKSLFFICWIFRNLR